MMRPRLLASALALAPASGLVPACAASDVATPARTEAPAIPPPGPAPPPPAARDDAPALPEASPAPRSLAEYEALATPLHCARAVRCGEIGASQVDRCLRENGARTRVLLGVARGVEAGRYRFDPGRAAACLRELVEAPCHVDVQTAPRACFGGPVAAALVPAVLPGGTCERWEECVDGICSGDLACPGRCRPRTPDVGGPCDHDVLCSEHLYCKDRKCQPRGDLGAPCDGHWQACRSDLVCQGYLPAVEHHHDDRPEQPGTCERRRGVDQPCRRDGLGNDCAAGLFCDFGAAAPACRTRLSEGSACTWLDACADGLRCDGIRLGEAAAPGGSGMRALAQASVCRRFVDAGAPCDPAAAQTACPSSMRCVDGSCRPRGDTGDPCQTRNDCGPYHACDPRRRACMPYGAPGEPCTPGLKGLEGPCFLSECDPTSRRCKPQCRRDR